MSTQASNISHKSDISSKLKSMRFMAKGSKLLLQTQSQVPSLPIPTSSSIDKPVQSIPTRKRKFTVLSDDSAVPQAVENILVPGRISFQSNLLPLTKEISKVNDENKASSGSAKNQPNVKKGKKEKKKQKRQSFDKSKPSSYNSNEKKQKKMMIFR
jgi:hypothetical protein